MPVKKETKKPTKKKTTKKKPKDVGGRPTKYKVEYNEQARKLCLLGYNDKQLSEFFNISESTLNLWKLEKEGFSESILKGKEFADCDVVSSAYNRAKGMTVKEVKISDDGTTTETIKEIPPDPTSFIFWLTNRQKDKWKRNQEKEDNTEQLTEGFIQIAKVLKGIE